MNSTTVEIKTAPYTEIKTVTRIEIDNNIQVQREKLARILVRLFNNDQFVDVRTLTMSDTDYNAWSEDDYPVTWTLNQLGLITKSGSQAVLSQMSTSVDVELKDIETVENITHVVIDNNIIVSRTKSARVLVQLLSGTKLITTKMIDMTDSDYDAWTNDDTYPITWAIAKLGFTAV